ncbi:type I glyceraldehyde-3-phosphate dehydrogenase [Philodulcilactobacillus myokoensis]|uniref:Glyceraldehyde-3-phosphate dehydrogenase n=1 Tax=Philodulcilactobacillus myokoensis TaxID=2929573 RepID=A0A9W6B391_9LACO|nr:type I glyceraldehyde-3-phosphate dehydrogenase [Philodulcilactobacillus myokoensis]GLB47129.1 type I glyceraldehyde-3-phosphate dehydrogenase [Philodulcilactobacillus myokoensis]
MTVKIGINGFGRIGRLAFRRIKALNSSDIEVVAINDLTTPSMLAYLLKYDTTHGRYPGKVTSTDDAIVVDGKKYPVYAQPDASKIPWVKNNGVDFVLECTGFYTSKAKAQAHLDAGVKRVLVSAPAGSDVKTVVPDVNLDTLDSGDKIVSAGSCTTSCLAPMAYWADKEFGIKVGSMVTAHSYTATQATLDGPISKKVQNNRAAAANTIPHTSGAAKAIGLVVPSLNGKLTGYALRVATPDGSVTQLDFVPKKHVTDEDVNKGLEKHANEAFGYTEDQIVSSDILDDTHGSLFEPAFTKVISGDDGEQIVRIIAWYDNEFGFTCNMVRTLLHFAKLAD